MTDDVKSRLVSLPNCPLCESSRRRKLYDLGLYRVHECLECRLRYIDPCLSPEGMQYYYASDERLLELNSFHSSYYDFGDPVVASKTVRDFDKVLDLLEKERGDAKKNIFDVGCGNGLFLAVAKRRGWNVAGCDPSGKNVALAKSRFGIDISRTSFEGLNLQGGKYDVICFWDVLEHLTDPHWTIQEAAKILSPNGKIVIGGPNDRSFLRMMASMIYGTTAARLRGPLRKVYLLEHVTYYTIETLKKLFLKHGLILKFSFSTSTDIEKYHLSKLEKILASTVLTAGKMLGFQNRMVAVFQALA